MRVGRINPQPLEAKKVSVSFSESDKKVIISKIMQEEEGKRVSLLRQHGFDAEADALEYEMAKAHLAEMKAGASSEGVSEEGASPAEQPVPEKKEKKQRKNSRKK